MTRGSAKNVATPVASNPAAGHFAVMAVRPQGASRPRRSRDHG
jgi:hypothetical protein